MAPITKLSFCPKTQNINKLFFFVLTSSDGRYTDSFYSTPRMSTYLVAFLIANDFVVEGNTDLQLIMNQKFKHKTNFTQEVAARAIDYYDSYTGMNYKSLGNDIMQMAGSNSFPHSGMENWGLIFYK